MGVLALYAVDSKQILTLELIHCEFISLKNNMSSSLMMTNEKVAGKGLLFCLDKLEIVYRCAYPALANYIRDTLHSP